MIIPERTIDERTCFADVLDDRLVEMEVATLVGDLA
jgi:hypothetical protein